MKRDYLYIPVPDGLIVRHPMWILLFPEIVEQAKRRLAAKGGA